MILRFVFVLISLIFVSCSDERLTDRKDVILMLQDSVKTLDSSIANDVSSFSIIGNTQENLFVYKGNEIILGAAKDMKISKDKLTYTFTLRDNLKWSDGAALTAYDYAFAWFRFLNTNENYPLMLANIKNYQNYKDKKAKIEDIGIKTPDDKTIIITLNKPISYLNQLLAHPSLSPMRKDIVERLGDNYGTTIDGMVFSGPFVVSEWKRGNKITLTKNKNYYNARNIKLNKVRFLDIKSIDTAYKMFLSNKLDILVADVDLLGKSPSKDYDQLHMIEPSTYIGVFNINGSKLMQSKKIRQALSLAINREEFGKSIGKMPAFSLVPFTLYRGVNNYDELQVVLKSAKINPRILFVEGLRELGLNTDPSRYSLNLLLRQNNDFYSNQAKYLKYQWNKILGIDLNIIKPLDFMDFLYRLNNGSFDIASFGWHADFNDPIAFLEMFSDDSSLNYGHYHNEKVESLFKDLQNTKYPDERFRIYRDIEDILTYEDPALLPLYFEEEYILIRKSIKGIQFSEFGKRIQLRYAYIAK